VAVAEEGMLQIGVDDVLTAAMEMLGEVRGSRDKVRE
jgi:hypothetical protein